MGEIGFLSLPVNSSLSAGTLAPDTIFFPSTMVPPRIQTQLSFSLVRDSRCLLFIWKTFHRAAGSHCPHQDSNDEVKKDGDMAQQVMAVTGQHLWPAICAFSRHQEAKWNKETQCGCLVPWGGEKLNQSCSGSVIIHANVWITDWGICIAPSEFISEMRTSEINK